MTWLRPCSHEQDGASARLGAAVIEAQHQSRTVVSRAFDSVERTQMQRRAIDDLLSRMDQRKS